MKIPRRPNKSPKKEKKSQGGLMKIPRRQKNPKEA
jgi:hypothetical protein